MPRRQALGRKTIWKKLTKRHLSKSDLCKGCPVCQPRQEATKGQQRLQWALRTAPLQPRPKEYKKHWGNGNPGAGRERERIKMVIPLQGDLVTVKPRERCQTPLLKLVPYVVWQGGRSVREGTSDGLKKEKTPASAQLLVKWVPCESVEDLGLFKLRERESQ